MKFKTALKESLKENMLYKFYSWIHKKKEIKQMCKCNHPIDDHVPDLECSKCECRYYQEIKA